MAELSSTNRSKAKHTMKVQPEIKAKLESLDNNERNLRSLAEIMKSAGVTPFVGAGMSVPLHPLWGDFLIEMASNAGAEATVKTQISSGQFEEAAQCLQRIQYLASLRKLEGAGNVASPRLVPSRPSAERSRLHGAPTTPASRVRGSKDVI